MGIRLLIGACAVILSLAAQGAAPGVSVQESRLIDRAVPDIPLQLADGRSVQISELWRDRPLLVTFFYRRCSGVCIPFLEWVRNATREAGGIGGDYRVLALSFDDADTASDVAAQAAALGLRDSPHWFFAVANREALARITGALDFWHRYDPARRQYEHNALIVGIEDGRVMRALVASGVEGGRMRELVWELRGSFIPLYAVPGQTALSCFTFDAVSGETRLDWGMLLLMLPALLALAAAVGIFALGSRRNRGGMKTIAPGGAWITSHR